MSEKLYSWEVTYHLPSDVGSMKTSTVVASSVHYDGRTVRAFNDNDEMGEFIALFVDVISVVRGDVVDAGV